MSIETRFEEIGARAKVREPSAVRRWGQRITRDRAPVIDVRHDRRGEYFDLVVPNSVEMEVIDTDADARHLLLLARVDAEKSRYLCGHDERHWFVAAIPESYPASTVEEAKIALQPDALREAAAQLPLAKRIRRRNRVYKRQGEWFFVAEPDFEPGPTDFIHRNEPMTRDRRSKPHYAEELVRSGGERVYLPNRVSIRDLARRNEINNKLGNSFAVTEPELPAMMREFPEVTWQPMIRNPIVHVRGAIRHSDHATLSLKGWHRVVMNRENLARASAHLAFFD